MSRMVLWPLLCRQETDYIAGMWVEARGLGRPLVWARVGTSTATLVVAEA